MGKLQYRGEEDERLKALKDMVKNAVEIFVEALSGMDERMSFKAFTLPKREVEDEVKMLVDVLMTAIAIEVKEQMGDKLDKIAVNCSTDVDDEGNSIVWIHAKVGAEPVEPVEQEVVKPVEKINTVVDIAGNEIPVAMLQG
jgi:hypothetical protein